jgi:hypothetical protein
MTESCVNIGMNSPVLYILPPSSPNFGGEELSLFSVVLDWHSHLQASMKTSRAAAAASVCCALWMGQCWGWSFSSASGRQAPRGVRASLAGLVGAVVLASGGSQAAIAASATDGATTPTTAVAQAATTFNPVAQLAEQATEKQMKQLKENELEFLRTDAKREPGSVVAKVLVSIKSDSFPLGLPDVSSFNALNTDESRLIVTAFGRTGPPIAASRIPLKNLQFPVLLELTDADLCFPLTKEAWKIDPRKSEDIGVAVVLDVDGQLATLDGGGLTGYGVSKVIKLGGSERRNQVDVAVQVNPALEARGQSALPEPEVAMLERIDAQLNLKDSVDAVARSARKPY